MRQFLGDPLELALEQAGIRASEVVCVRGIRVSVRLRLSLSDSELLAHWARLIAEALAAGASDTQSEIGIEAVRYPSRPLALIEMATHIAQGRFHNSWAWRQMDFWRISTDEAPGHVAAVGELAGALEREPGMATAVLAELARAGKLRPLLPHIAERLADIAAAVLTLARTGGDWRAAMSMPDPAGIFFSPDLETERTRPPEIAAERRAERIIGRSCILAVSKGVALSQTAEAAAILLSILECEPAIARAGSEEIARSIKAIQALSPGRKPFRIESRPPRVRPATPAIIEQRAGELPKTLHENIPAGETAPASLSSQVSDKAAERTTPTESPAPDIESARTIPNEPAAPGQIQRDLRPGDLEQQELRAQDLYRGELHPPAELPAQPDLKQREAITEFGGLLFLIRILDRLAIPDRLFTAEATAQRGLAWFLHNLALIVQPLAPDDPAALAFCGLAPGVRHPSEDTLPASAEEHALLDTLAEEVRTNLADVLAAAMPREPRMPPERAIQFVCRRFATVVADPGWIELRFPMRDVSTVIRRAALDLDPNYVPWLGIVVRFIYE
jgi:hypothetical protein